MDQAWDDSTDRIRKRTSKSSLSGGGTPNAGARGSRRVQTSMVTSPKSSSRGTSKAKKNDPPTGRNSNKFDISGSPVNGRTRSKSARLLDAFVVPVAKDSPKMRRKSE